MIWRETKSKTQSSALIPKCLSYEATGICYEAKINASLHVLSTVRTLCFVWLLREFQQVLIFGSSPACSNCLLAALVIVGTPLEKIWKNLANSFLTRHRAPYSDYIQYNRFLKDSFCINRNSNIWRTSFSSCIGIDCFVW